MGKLIDFIEGLIRGYEGKMKVGSIVFGSPPPRRVLPDTPPKDIPMPPVRPTLGKRDAGSDASEEERKAVGDVDRAIAQLNQALDKAGDLGLKMDITVMDMSVIGKTTVPRYIRRRCMKHREIEIKPL